ncbi:uncharacterized protein [Temnothorax longispinosus]|uniref:uncharacterized protein isoform X2 n=1 Tax=Temnothorax longispinosus TaxID=300112 RepID=UPI003A995E1A
MDDLLLIALVNMEALLVQRRRNRKRHCRRRRVWVRPINTRRRQQGAFYNLFQEMKTDPQMFHKYTRMTLPTFQHLMDIVNPSLMKRSPRALEPEQRVAVTLRFLIGDKVPEVAFAYRVGLSTVHKIIKETCDVFGRLLGPIYLRAPSREEYLQIAEGFWTLWNFPHCLGAIDGKHVDAQCPPNSGKNSDAGIYGNSYLNVTNEMLDIPEGTSCLSGTDIQVPYFFIGDEAFPIGKHLMRPYAGRYLGERKNIFNYRLSRARRIIENTFGILAKKWGIYNRPIAAIPDNINKYILATVCLHNFLRNKEGNILQFENNDEIIENNENGAFATHIKDSLCNYFMTPNGMVN